jgi:hypothetical protein
LRQTNRPRTAMPVGPPGALPATRAPTEARRRTWH